MNKCQISSIINQGVGNSLNNNNNCSQPLSYKEYELPPL